jgi:hypothetical protein
MIQTNGFRLAPNGTSWPYRFSDGKKQISPGTTRDLAPFWRVVESSSPMAKKLRSDPAWIDLQRELES